MIKAVQLKKETENIFLQFMNSKAEAFKEDLYPMYGAYLLIEPGESVGPSADGLGITINHQEPITLRLVESEVFLQNYKFIEGADLNNFAEIRRITPSDWEYNYYRKEI